MTNQKLPWGSISRINNQFADRNRAKIAKIVEKHFCSCLNDDQDEEKSPDPLVNICSTKLYKHPFGIVAVEFEPPPLIHLLGTSANKAAVNKFHERIKEAIEEAEQIYQGNASKSIICLAFLSETLGDVLMFTNSESFEDHIDQFAPKMGRLQFQFKDSEDIFHLFLLREYNNAVIQHQQ